MSDKLIEKWRERATEYRGIEALGAAQALERAADELQEAAWEEQHALVAIEEAAKRSGYSVNHLHRLASDGKIKKEVRDGRSFVYLAELPMKPALNRDGGI